MKKHILSLLSASCLLTTSAFALDSQKPVPQWELNGSTNGDFKIRKLNYDGSDSISTLYITATGGYFFNANWELEAQAAYATVSNNGGHSLGVLVGPNYNFCTNPEDSVYLGAQVGLTFTSISDSYTTSTTTRFTWAAHLGKRFSLMEHVTWSPEIEYEYIGDKTNGIVKTYGSTSWAFKVIQFAFLF